MILKDEYKTAVVGGFDGKQKVELFLLDPSYYPYIAKDFPHFFIDEEKKTTPADDLRSEIELDKPKKYK